MRSGGGRSICGRPRQGGRGDDAARGERPCAAAGARGGGGRRPAASALSATGWRPRGDLALADWAEQGRRFGTIGRAAGWWIGDWLQYGNSKFGERYSRASRITGYDVQTLMNMVYVASRVDTSQRRENLSWSHHAEVAALPPEERGRWLDVAESERLSVRCLREEIRRARRAIEPPKPDRSEPGIVCPNCGERMEKEDRRGGARNGG
ncbi:MAG TPA: hypothetical protein VFV85_02940 [Conexibacter sp.]|nr:hypothetical protein [Conexibacter sp.]